MMTGAVGSGIPQQPSGGAGTDGPAAATATAAENNSRIEGQTEKCNAEASIAT